MNCFSFLGFIVDWNGRVCGYMKRVEETLILIASPIFSQGDIKFGSSPGAKIVVFAISWWSVTLPTLTLGAGTTLKLELERTDSLGHHSAYSTNRISFVTLSTSTCYYNILPLSSSMIILTVANPLDPSCLTPHPQCPSTFDNAMSIPLFTRNPRRSISSLRFNQQQQENATWSDRSAIPGKAWPCSCSTVETPKDFSLPSSYRRVS